MNESKTNYVISFDTLVMSPKTYGKRIYTSVIEQNDTFTIAKKPLHIVTRSCKFYGGSFDNAMQSSANLLGRRHKLPLLIANSYGMPFIFIPTMSAKSDYNTWIAYHAIDSFLPDGLQTIVKLKNGMDIKIGVTVATMYRQFSLARLVEINFINKQKELNRTSNLLSSQEPEHTLTQREHGDSVVLEEHLDELYSSTKKISDDHSSADGSTPS
ncbi:competence protein ComK [Sporosarcina saromensis]|uniref:Competence protein ComK n=1 Tax=Sporosarcina saromensis TaxID=359365 RepID=A0ABU4G6G0_9BACL|nr:competence protein ComK [Sporosarcina saromensis]MDW0112564.1 competence protein ComK [Sporosarcina saromensis]